MFNGATLVPNALLFLGGVAFLLLVAFLAVLLTDRNPLPFPDRDYHVFSVTSRPALAAFERLMQQFGHIPRFRIDSEQVDRTVFSNGTIINHPHPTMFAKLGRPGAALGFVVSDPDTPRVSPRSSFNNPDSRLKSFVTQSLGFRSRSFARTLSSAVRWYSGSTF